MKNKGFVIHNSKRFDYEIDEYGIVWILMEMGKTNIG